MWLWISVAGNIVLLAGVLYSWFYLIRYVGRIMRLRKANRRYRRMLRRHGLAPARTGMYINRAVAVIKRKQPYVDWVNGLPDSDKSATCEELSHDSTVYLIPHYDLGQEAEEHIREMYEMIFEKELEGWYEDPNLWPAHRDYEMFKQWFEIEFHSEIIDTLDERIKKTDW